MLNPPSMTLDDPTRTGSSGGGDPRWVYQVTLLCHPDLRRIGEVTWLQRPELLIGFARGFPQFGRVGGPRRSIADRRISRQPLGWSMDGEQLLLLAHPKLRLDGQPVDFTTPVPETAFDSGVQLTLGERVLLSIRRVVGPSSIYLPSVGGIGPAMLELHQRIHTLARLATPVLICGTAGSGKGAVVRALHTLRSGAHPLNAVSGNAEARGSSLHVELFGTADHPGLAAHPGGLWIRDLDALDRPRWGALTQLLDGLYPGGSRPVSPPRVYATTHDLTEVPPALRERFADRIDVPAPQAEDIAWHFADAAVERLKQLQVQRWEGESEGWIRPAQMQALMHRPLTGGLQEVRNLARRAAVESPPAQCSLPADEGLSEPDWLQLLVANDYRIAPTARRAGISPNTLRRRMEEAGLPTAKTLTPGQIQEASSANSADPARMAKQLRVSLHGLRLRLQDDADD